MHLTKRERATIGRDTVDRLSSAKLARNKRPMTTYVGMNSWQQRGIDSHLVEHEVDQTGKGLFKGKCNRTACDHRGEGIAWWNRSTRAYYCRDCRNAIDSWIDRNYGPCFHKHPHSADGAPHPDDQNERVA